MKSSTEPGTGPVAGAAAVCWPPSPVVVAAVSGSEAQAARSRRPAKAAEILDTIEERMLGPLNLSLWLFGRNSEETPDRNGRQRRRDRIVACLRVKTIAAAL